MTDESLNKYAHILGQFSNTSFGRKERAGLFDFLKREDQTPENIDSFIGELKERIENGMRLEDVVVHPDYRWAFYRRI